MRVASGIIGICALGLGASSLAMPPQSAALPAWNNPVPSVPAANRISAWEPVDSRHVVIRVNSQERYLLTLREVCPGLSYARNVGVTMSDNTIWAGFDAITTDAVQCEIKRIDRERKPTSAGSAPGN